MISGLTTRCSSRPNASHTRFSGCRICGRTRATIAKAAAMPSDHQRGARQIDQRPQPMIRNTTANTMPKPRSEPSGAGPRSIFGSMADAMGPPAGFRSEPSESRALLAMALGHTNEQPLRARVKSRESLVCGTAVAPMARLPYAQLPAAPKFGRFPSTLPRMDGVRGVYTPRRFCFWRHLRFRWLKAHSLWNSFVPGARTTGPHTA